jgi:hypothetical protein
LSWCNTEVVIESPKDVVVWDASSDPAPVPAAPPLVVLSFSAKVVQRRPVSEIVGLRCALHRVPRRRRSIGV